MPGTHRPDFRPMSRAALALLVLALALASPARTLDLRPRHAGHLQAPAHLHSAVSLGSLRTTHSTAGSPRRAGFPARGNPGAVIKPMEHDAPRFEGATATEHHHPPGIMVWASGRTGTTAFWNTLRLWLASSGMTIEALCGAKEPFTRRREMHLSEKAWTSCMALSREPHFEHIKPMHLQIAEDDDLTSPEGLFALAKRMGVKVVATIERRNWLARRVSGAERIVADMLRKENDPSSQDRLKFMANFFSYQNATESKAAWRQRHSEHDMERTRGAAMAKQLGMRVVSFAFNPDSWPCEQVTETVRAAVEEGVFPRMPTDECTPRHGQSDYSSYHSLPLEQRIGSEAAAVVAEALRGSADEWMLDLDRESPPGLGELAPAPHITNSTGSFVPADILL